MHQNFLVHMQLLFFFELSLVRKKSVQNPAKLQGCSCEVNAAAWLGQVQNPAKLQGCS